MGRPGSYRLLGNLYGRVICAWDARTNLNLLRMFWSHANGWCTGFLQGFYRFATIFWRRGRKNPYGYRTVTVRLRTVTVRLQYGYRTVHVEYSTVTVRCMWTHMTACTCGDLSNSSSWWDDASSYGRCRVIANGPPTCSPIAQRPAVCPHRVPPSARNLPHGRLSRCHVTARL